MLRRNINWKKLLGPSDSVALVVIIVGLLIAIFIDELAIRLIGVCVSLLGGVALAMLISQRMADIVEVRYKPSQQPPDYKITIKKETGAKRQTFEDFEELTTESDENYSEAGKSRNVEDDLKVISRQYGKPKKENLETDLGESFKVIDKRAGSQPDTPADKLKAVQTAPSVENKVSLDLKEDYTFDDGTSGIRIIGKITPKVQTTGKVIIIGEDKHEDKPQDKDTGADKKDIVVEETKYEKDTLFETVNNEPDQEAAAAIDTKELADDAEVEREPEIKDAVNREVRGQTRDFVIEPVKNFEAQQERKANHSDELAKAVQEKIQKEKQESKPDFNQQKFDIPLSTIIETESFSGQEPRKEFEYFLNGVLKVIRSITNTRTAAFLLVNNEKREMILQSFDSQSPEAITPKQKLPIRNDIISQIAVNLKPELLTEINPSVELDLIPYYTKRVGTGSFVGVPVFYNKTLIGILCADSAAPDAYEAFTVSFLGQFTKLIGTLVNTYTEKYELLQASRALSAIDSIETVIAKQDIELDDIYISILEAACTVFDFTTIGICGYNQENETWRITAISSKDDSDRSLAGAEVNTKTTYVGQSITTQKTIFISPMMDRGMMFHKKETKYPAGFFVSTPLKSMNNTYGALFVVGRSQSNITNYDVKILEILSTRAGNSIEHFIFMKMLKNNSMVEQGGILNEGAFISRLEEEMIKAGELGNIVVLCLFSLDMISALNPQKYPERTDKATRHVFDIFKKYLKSYHPLGKVDDEKYSVILTGMKAPEAQRWAEKIRQEIARSPLEIENKRYYVTVSIGLAEAMKGDTMNELASNANRALMMSVNKTNKVTVYE